jgi:Tetratricopeptide repeat
MQSAAENAHVFGNDNIVVQAEGSGVSVNIGALPYLRLTQYERRTKLAARDNSEAALLSAYRADVVPLIGRDGALAVLRAWLEAEAPVSVRVLVGAGGRGKTRLALELARQIANDGWLAGFATAEELDRFRNQNGVEQWRWDKPALIILDYAASRAEQLRAWICELVDASVEDRPKLRLLLLERQANRAIGWLATVFGQGDNDDSRAAVALLDPKEPIELPALNELEFRRQVFGALLKRAKGALEAPAEGADPEFDRLLADHKWAGDPLYLMMAGLVAASKGVGGALALSRADLTLSMARNELDRIGRIGAARGVDEKHRFPGAFVRQMAAIVTLLQGVTVAEARDLAAREKDALRSPAGLDATVGSLTDALPASDANGGVAPILPDIIGEGAILAWFGPNGGLATGGVDAAGRIAAVARASVGKASATLMRTAQDFAEAGRAEPVHWLDALAGAPETDLGALMEIANALPDNTFVLRETAATLQLRIVDRARGAAEVEQRAGSGDQRQSILASSLNNLGNRLSDLGRREDAFAAAQEATDTYRRLAAARPDAFLPDLALSLNNLGGRLSELGRREDALAAAQEATDIYRRLAAARPDAFLPDLAGSLGTLGNCLTALDKVEQALATRREAVATLTPFFLRWPARHAHWMGGLTREYLESCEKLGVEPDAALLMPIVEAFKKSQAPDEGVDPNA